ncbi:MULTISPECIES: RDD family protein [Arthrobacter]|uniref:RDD family protein n=1 Tax=unclassified Arthrobacter TaxID=235627 RepID=UPI0024BAC415|nr:RDD family protein [Arthrobacter sp. H35-MC1]MDJ0317185.1 RDD family protein [Arthrobacter sp. H35-MC1]
MSAIITGEAVVLELRPATFAARSLATAIDVTVTLIVGLGLVLLLGALPFLVDFAALRAIVLVLVVTLLVIVPITVETLSRGKSLGKLAMGLRIVRDDGGSIRFRHAMIRALLAVLEIYMTLGSLACLVSLFNEKSKRLGDMLAGTYAIRDRSPKTVPLQVAVAPELAQWAALSDIGRLPDTLARRISMYLSQGAAMATSSRHSLGVELAEEASRYVAPLPAPGTDPRVFLSSLIAERRDREFKRMTLAAQRASTVRARLQRHGVRH